jgi:GNAT superfamily N-acetyltransferase
MTDMLVRLYDIPDVTGRLAALREKGIGIRRAMAHEKHDVVEWVRSAFGPGWAGECDVAFANQPISCYIATEQGLIRGFACYDSTCKDFFGPMGVLEANRGSGIGAALLLSCLHAMSAQGYAYAIVGGVGPGEFYARTVGAVPIAGSTPGIYRDGLRKRP